MLYFYRNQLGFHPSAAPAFYFISLSSHSLLVCVCVCLQHQWKSQKPHLQPAASGNHCSYTAAQAYFSEENIHHDDYFLNISFTKLSFFSEFPFICILPLPNKNFPFLPTYNQRGYLEREGEKRKVPGTAGENCGEGEASQGQEDTCATWSFIREALSVELRCFFVGRLTWVFDSHLLSPLH